MTHISYQQFFATLSGDSRLDILHFLQQNGTQNVSEIALGTGQEQSAVSHSLKKLLACSCVSMEVRGKNRFYALNSETIDPIMQLADRHIQNYCKTDCTDCAECGGRSKSNLRSRELVA